MPRANRYFLPGYIWHITHRCHRRDFLLRFIRDRRRYLHWLFEAKKRQDLTILNYMVTSNHIHLLVEGGEDRGAIPRGMQLAAGRTGQEYNMRKRRKGAFRVWGVACRVSGACVVQKSPSTEVNSEVGAWCVFGRLVQK
mgnify:CR=1 FL=1